MLSKRCNRNLYCIDRVDLFQFATSDLRICDDRLKFIEFIFDCAPCIQAPKPTRRPPPLPAQRGPTEKQNEWERCHRIQGVGESAHAASD